ncbi:MAG TPA: sarcosine oxidase subunit gamma family protein [Usitatibacter sp.]|nr:sarcosine oxidase subunit gamma family protein [Usitatibacter sp.]
MTATIERLAPLAGWKDAFARASASPQAFAIRERPFTTQVNLRGDATDGRFAAAVREAFGCALPPAANTFASGPQGEAIWLGPDEWLLVAQPDRGDAITQALRGALAGMRGSITDVSAARTVIEIAGDEARLVLAKGCPLDLHASAFAPESPATPTWLRPRSRSTRRGVSTWMC